MLNNASTVAMMHGSDNAWLRSRRISKLLRVIGPVLPNHDHRRSIELTILKQEATPLFFRRIIISMQAVQHFLICSHCSGSFCNCLVCFHLLVSFRITKRKWGQRLVWIDKLSALGALIVFCKTGVKCLVCFPNCWQNELQ